MNAVVRWVLAVSLFLVPVAAMASEIGAGCPNQTDFTFTGAPQSFTVPANVTSIQLNVFGAQGAIGTGSAGGAGGLGGRAIGNLAVTAGQVLDIFVGGAATNQNGGFNGGGNGGLSFGGGGGGRSDVRVAGNPVIIAGGGGGGGAIGCVAPHAGGAGGAGNGLAGGNGADSPN